MERSAAAAGAAAEEQQWTKGAGAACGGRVKAFGAGSVMRHLGGIWQYAGMQQWGSGAAVLAAMQEKQRHLGRGSPASCVRLGQQAARTLDAAAHSPPPSAPSAFHCRFLACPSAATKQPAGSHAHLPYAHSPLPPITAVAAGHPQARQGQARGDGGAAPQDGCQAQVGGLTASGLAPAASPQQQQPPRSGGGVAAAQCAPPAGFPAAAASRAFQLLRI